MVKGFIAAVAVFAFLFFFLEAKLLLLDLFRRIASVKVQRDRFCMYIYKHMLTNRNRVY